MEYFEKISKMRHFTYFILVAAAINLAVICLTARPIQDDYVILSNLSTKGFINSIFDFWDTWGGNITPVITRTIFLVSFQTNQTIIGLSLFVFYVFLIVALAIWCFLDLNVQEKIAKETYFLVVAITVIGFEGILSPGNVGAFQFGTASAVHLLPICYGIIGIHISHSKSSGAYFMVILLGLASGNSNPSEGLAMLLVSIAYFVANNKKYFNLSEKKVYPSKLAVFISMQLIGLVAIFIAPGFGARAREIGVTSNLRHIGLNFFVSGIDFFGDFLAHPVWFLAFVLGVLSKNRTTTKLRKNFHIFLPLLLVIAVIISGAAFSYPAWHQSIGFYLFTSPTFYLFGASRSLIRVSGSTVRHKKTVLTLVFVIVAAQVIRADLTALNRAEQWDRNFITNVCRIESGSTDKLLGAEIVYSPLNVGITDVGTWIWMADAYRVWIKATNPKISDCAN
jgi:hypothetical protein